MKKALTLAVLSGCFATGALHAQVNIHISGSTAFRANAYRGIRTSFDGGAPTAMNPANATSGTSIVTFQGTMSALFGSQTVTVYADYNGSVQGLGDLANSTALSFTNITPGGGSVSAVPDITFSDADHVATLFPNVAVTETHVAVLPFTYVRGYYTPTSVTNITSHQLNSLWNNGALALSFFTGNPADDSNTMYVTGRNRDSGSRVCGDTDAYFSGTPIYWGFNTTAPTVWAVMNQNLAGSLYGFGYSSGGNEATAITNQNAGGPVVGYEGMNDALTVAGSASTGVPVPNGGGGCSIIAFQGVLPMANYTPGSTQVPAKPDFTPIIKGQYDFWSYECLEMLNTHTADNVYHYYTNMVTVIDQDIANGEAAGGNSSVYGPVTDIRLSEMKVSRTSVGGPITPN